MRILVGNSIYEFTVAQDEDVVISPDSSMADEFQIDLKFRLLENELRRSINLPRSGFESSMSASMAELLEEFDVPEQARGEMATHFQFYLERLSRRNLRRRGAIAVAVNLDVKVMAAERAAAIQSRMEAGRRENRETRRAVRAAAEVVVEVAPAKKAAVEELVRERMVRWSEEGEERVCSICLEAVAVGAEVIRMPCLHVYHKDCILRWLQRNHFCPFCRFKLPACDR